MTASVSDVQLAQALSALKEKPDVETYIAHCSPARGPGLPTVTLLFAKFREDAPDIEALAEWLWLNAINYVIPLKKRRKAVAASSNSGSGGDLSISTRLVTATRRAFINFNKQYPARASEVGELLAYLIALKYLDAPQIASKMALKTNANMPVHGLDGVHASFENGIMTLFFLESKLTKTAAAGAADYAKSVSGFGSSRKQYLLEYEILSDLGNLDALADDDKDAALAYFDVYGTKKSQRIERSVGIICYSESKVFSNKLPKTSGTPPSEHEKNFSGIYGSQLEVHRNLVKTQLQKHGLDPADCELYFVAVPDVAELRKLFSDNMT